MIRPIDDRQQVILWGTLVCGGVGGVLAIGLYSGFWEVGFWQTVLVLIAGTGVGTGLAFYVLTAEPGGRPSQLPPSRHSTVQPADPASPYGVEAVQPPRHRVPANRPAVPQAHQPPEPAKLVLPLAGTDTAGTLPRQWWNERQTAGAVPPATGGAAPAAGAPPATAGSAPPATAGSASPAATGSGSSVAAGSAPPPAAQADRRGPSPIRRTPAPPLSGYDAASALIAQCPRCGEFRLDVSTVSPGYAFRCVAGCGNRWEWTPGTPWPPVVVRRNLSGRSVAEDGGTEQRERWR